MESDICGLIVNTATAYGTDPCGYLTLTAQGVFSVRPRYNADLSIVKTASLTGTCPGSDPLAVSIGDTVTYCFNVTNTGDVTLTSVTVNDDLYGPVTLGTTSLAPGETTEGTLTHVVVESDAPSVTNTATATGTDPCGGTVIDSDPCTINVAIAPDIEVNKTAYPTAGPPCTNVTFTINVTNTGDCALNPVTVEDTLPVGMSYVATGTSPAPSSVVGNRITWNNVGPLNPGAFTTITLVALIDTGAEGTLTDTVNATGKPPAGDNVTDSDTADVTVTGLTCTCGDICVNETGWWRDGGAFTASGTPIQGAIDNAIAGETICVKDGTYNENVDVDTPLTIKSENGADSTIVQAADPDDHVFEVTADYVNISGFTISGVYSGWKAGIGLYYADYCYISNNNVFKNPGFSNPAYGICLDHSSNNTVSNNDVSESGYHGIYLKSSHYNNILSNTITKNPHKGIWLYYSNNNNINNNTCSNNGGGIELKASVNNNVMENTYLNNGIGGISIWVCSDINYIENNICSSNGYRGIYLDSSHNQRITKNICTNNDKGILLSWGSSKNIITKNTCSNNNYGIWLGSLSASNNVIYLNNLINNNQNVYSTESSTNFWNSPSELTYTYSGSTYTNHLGNYWSDYSENDTDRDGIGDTPYSIIGSDNDNYPLMELWENYLPFVYDTTPPSSITNLQNTTGTTWINWTWTNPPEADFNYTMIHLDGTWKINTSNEYYNATKLNPDTSYEIRTHTVDKVGNVNETWVNQTAKTKTAKVPPNIISFAPPSPVSNNEGESRTFNITVDQIVNVSWQINGSIVQTNECVAEASYTNTSAVVGTWNVSAIASNPNGTDMQTWIWDVTEAPQGNDWGIKLDVTSGAGTDVAEFGLNVDATDGFDAEFDVPEPPSPPPPYQQAYFYYPENTLIKKLSTSYIPHHYVDGAEWNSWPFRVDYSGDASDITITWNAGDIAAVPENYSLFFVVDGDQVDMRTTPSYTFSATTGTYEFEIIAITAVPYTFECSTGWNMISFPVEPRDKDADTIFGPEYYYLCTWDPDTGCYVPMDEVETEIGYWLLVLEDRSVTVLGTQLSEYNTDLAQGWNMIGSLWTATNVPGGTETVPADQMYPYIYGWCGDHYELTQDIEPGLGYWALAYNDCELHVFPAPPAAPLPVQQITWGDNDWHVRLAVTSGAGTDVAEFGLHEDATYDFSAKLDVPEPPSPPPSSTSPYQQVYFYNPENPLVKKLSTCYIPHHFVDDDEEYNSWLFIVEYSGDASDVTITWNAEDINAVPAEYSLLFIADGEQIDMRTTPSYTFRAKTRTYEFEIRAITGGKKPDLVIEDSYEKGKAGRYTVFFVVKNIGTATAPEGHYATLYVDGVEKDKKLVSTDLEPGETYKGSFKTKVGLTGKVENIKVCADSYDDVDELDEANNCLKGRWQPVVEKPTTEKPPAGKPPKEKGAGLGD